MGTAAAPLLRLIERGYDERWGRPLPPLLGNGRGKGGEGGEAGKSGAGARECGRRGEGRDGGGGKVGGGGQGRGERRGARRGRREGWRERLLLDKGADVIQAEKVPPCVCVCVCVCV